LKLLLRLVVLYMLGLLLFLSCKKDKQKDDSITAEPSLYEQDEELSAGIRTINDQSSLAFSYQLSGLNPQEKLDFFVGNSFFNQNWVEAPSSTTARDGLGPFFNARSCAGCHFRDGRGEPFANKGLLFRLSIIAAGNSNNAPTPDANYGGQLSDNAIQGVAKEGSFNVIYNEQAGQFSDGETFSLRIPSYSFSGLNYGAMNAGILFSPRIGQQMIGLGLIEALTEQSILNHEDASDINNDGISGKANYVYDTVSKSQKLGKFGWKANVSNLYHQTAGAYIGDLGITNWLFKVENCTSIQNDCQMAVNGGTPEIDSTNLNHTVLYTRTLGVPIRRNYKDENVLLGKKMFEKIGCENCHTAKYTTGNNASVSALNNITIRPYSDFLLHDMGNELADNRPDFLANGNEWRTQPLWGLGLIKTVNGHSFLLHDGRARNIKEAILWHGGEASVSKEKFKSLSKTERDNVIAFLNSL
jgi:CxxC motif-containing protein (DUF1111 family)